MGPRRHALVCTPLYAAVLLLIVTVTSASEDPLDEPVVSVSGCSGQDEECEGAALLQIRRVPNASANVRDASIRGSDGPVSISSMAGFKRLKQLRAGGFHCPDGKYFEPNHHPLEFDCRLWKASVAHSRDMARRGYFAHKNPEGEDPFDRTSKFGLPTFNEIIAAGGDSVTKHVDKFAKGVTTCSLMMDPKHNRIAFGHAHEDSSKYKTYWTLLLADDKGQADRTCYTDETDGGDSKCEDISQDCSYWVTQGFCHKDSKYYGFMAEKCAKSCSFC